MITTNTAAVSAPPAGPQWSQVDGGAWFKPGQRGIAGLGGELQVALQDHEPEFAEHGIVDGETPTRVHLAEVIDELGGLQPRSAHRDKQRRHMLAGNGERIAGMEELTVHQEPYVGDDRDLPV